MQIIRKNGATSNILRVKLRNATTGQGLTALTSASTGLIISTICDNEAAATTYTVAGSTIETISTLATYATPTATKCRFKLVDDTNHPGLYEIQLADARFAVSSAKVLRINISGATSLLDTEVVVQLTTLDVVDSAQIQADSAKIGGQTASASGTVTFPNATLASTTNITAATGVDVTKWNGTTVATPDTAGYPKTTIKNGTGTGEIITSAGIATVNASQIGGTSQTGGDVIKELTLRCQAKTYYVNSAFGNDSNSGMFQTPLLTIAAAAALMKYGDTMHLSGSFTGPITNSAHGITIEGDGIDSATLTLNATGQCTFTNTGNFVTVRNIKIVNLHVGGSCVNDSATYGCVYENVFGDADLDGFVASASKNIKLIGYISNSKYDGITFTGNAQGEVHRPVITCDGSNGVGTSARAIYIAGNCTVRVFSPHITFTRTNLTTTGGDSFGIGVSAASTVEVFSPRIFIFNLLGVGKTIGIGATEDGQSCNVTVHNPYLTVINSGSGANWDLDPGTVSANLITLAVNGNTDSSKWRDVTKVRQIDGDAYTAAAQAAAAATSTSGLTYTTPGKVDATADIALSPENIDDIASGIADALPVSAANVDKDHTWKFDSPSQVTAPNIVNEVIGFVGLVQMDFDEPMPARSSIASITSAAFANDAGTEPTVTSSAMSTDKKKVLVLIDASAATAGTYTISVKAVTTDSQTFVRKGRITLT